MQNLAHWWLHLVHPQSRAQREIVGMQARRLIGKPWTWASPIPPLPKPSRLDRRLMALKPPTRAAVHGVKLSVPDFLNEEEAEKEIEKGKREKEEKRKQLEEAVDSKVNSSQLPLPPVK